jgi:hypothetical protein
LAALHAGVLGLSCEDCQHVPDLRTERGCEAPAQRAVWYDGEDEYYTCPLCWLSDSIINWYDEYLYTQEFGTALSYNDQSNRFIEAWQQYKIAFNRFSEEKMRHTGKVDGLQTLKAGFFRGRQNGQRN